MKKSKLLISMIVTLSVITLSFTYYYVSAESSQEVKQDNKQQTTNANVEQGVEDININYDVQKGNAKGFGVNKLNEKVIPKGLKEIEIQTRTMQQNGHQLNVVSQGWVDQDAQNKLKSEQKELLITQSDDDGSNKPMNILKEGEKVEVAGVDGWILNPDLEDPTQIMFWKNGSYYNVRGQNIPIDQLKEIAASMFNEKE